ncbi:putative heterodisulfide reductase, C subunit [Thermincola ferriacetica]|uniref:Putative heterodisulfide reductase, C subunit n=1 Tax=Thermincola ferriacetica TaxID=281456 RepID=A0A0L6W403_9FIRM|nr:4Fe-4S dicluster domain-containing protein [Thermincola ferriacetica]KNZ70265.1 putative heterodisulfide reductase, C subunit [Thermincola ferriacetica]
MSETVNLSQVQRDHSDFVERVYRMSGQDVRKCYQCGKCSAGCAVHRCKGFDVSPNRVMRMVQLGMEDEVLRTKTIWTCVLCSTCTARCPRDIDIARVMDALRIMSKKKNITEYAKTANIFHQMFMDNIAKWGRMYEFSFIVGYTLKTGYGLSLVDLGPQTLLKGNLAFFPPKTKNRGVIKEIMENIERMEGEK